MSQLTSSQTAAVKLLADRLAQAQYAIRGTCSLVLQNIDMNVADIDVVCNEETALKATALFSEYVQQPVTYKESPKFKSYFGKFDLNGVDVEFMGNWQIKDPKGNWSKVYDGANYNEIAVEGSKIHVTKIDEELEVFLLMGRFTAYHKIKRQLGLQPPTKKGTIQSQKGLFI
jgi:hypothetical protein